MEKDVWHLICNFGKSTSEENGSGEAETPEVNHHRPIQKDAWHLIYDFGQSTSEEIGSGEAETLEA
jgi:hypothetical protein